MNTNEELIARAREMTVHRCVDAPEQECGQHGDEYSRLLSDLADALEAAMTEWEYGYELIEPDDRSVFEREGFFVSPEFARRAAKKRIHDERHPEMPTLQYAIIQRRKPGAWEPITNEGVKP